MNITQKNNEIPFYAMRFEKFIFIVLRRFSSEKNIDVYFDNSYSNELITRKYLNGFDAFFDSGFDIEGNVYEDYCLYVEVKYRLYPEIYNRIIEKYNKIKAKSDKKSRLLIITNSDIKNSKRFKDIKVYDDVTIWSLEDIEVLKTRYPFDSNTVFGTEYKISAETISQVNETNINSLRTEIQGENYFTFVLGAGVSRDYGVPIWNSLIETFMKKVAEKTKLNDEEYIFSKIGDTSLIKAQFIIDNFSSKKTIEQKEYDFCIELREQVYQRKEFEHFNNTSMNSVVNLIKRINKNNNELVKVITYNYDDILEKTFEHKEYNMYQTIYTDTRRLPSKLPIYHVHGYLPRSGPIDIEMSDSIVFSEYKYHKLFNNPYLWQLSCQLSRFREDLCIFIGFSIIDPSVRRLLESIVEKNTKSHHYAIFAKDKAYNRSVSDIEIISQHFSRLGIHIIWVDEYSDIPKYIDTLKV